MFKNKKDFEEIEIEVVGIAHDNENGTPRYKIFENCHIGNHLILKHSPVKQDKNAVKVFTEAGEQVGFLPAIFAKSFSKKLDKGEMFTAEIVDISRWMNGAHCMVKINKES